MSLEILVESGQWHLRLMKMGGNETQLWHDSVNPFQPDAGRSAAGSPRNLESSSAGGVAPVEQSSQPKKNAVGKRLCICTKFFVFG